MDLVVLCEYVPEFLGILSIHDIHEIALCSHKCKEICDKHISLRIWYFTLSEEFKDPTDSKRHYYGRLIGLRYQDLIPCWLSLHQGNPADVAYGAALSKPEVLEQLIRDYPQHAESIRRNMQHRIDFKCYEIEQPIYVSQLDRNKVIATLIRSCPIKTLPYHLFYAGSNELAELAREIISNTARARTLIRMNSFNKDIRALIARIGSMELVDYYLDLLHSREFLNRWEITNFLTDLFSVCRYDILREFPLMPINVRILRDMAKINQNMDIINWIQ